MAKRGASATPIAGASVEAGRLDASASAGTAPRTERGRRTMRALLDAAAIEFGERGFHEASISGSTRRAGAALGSFYTYFDSKDAVFRALVRDMSGRARDEAAPAIRAAKGQIAAERAGLLAFMEFVQGHKEIYRIIDESEFVDPESFRLHYNTTADRIAARLKATAEHDEIRTDNTNDHTKTNKGKNVFLGLRFGVWADDLTPTEVADAVADMLEHGFARGCARATYPYSSYRTCSGIHRSAHASVASSTSRWTPVHVR